MLSLIRVEILKTFFKWRTYIGFVAIAVVIPLVQIAVKLEGGPVTRSVTQGLGQEFIFVGNLLNGYFVTQFIMNFLWVHVPFLITLGAGDQLAGEATGGTFRLLLIRPVSRTRILTAKYLTTLLYTFGLVAFLGLFSMGLGVILFGSGDLVVAGRTLVVIPNSEALWRLVVAFGLATWGMFCVASLAFLFSSLVENAIGPIIGTMAVIIVFYVISSIPIELFQSIKPYIFTSYLDLWQRMLEQPIPWGEVVQSVAILGGFSIGFYLTTWYIFVKKDILS